MTETETGCLENVAYLLCKDIAGTLDLKDKSEDYRKDLLDLYAECLEATKGRRS